MKRLLPLLTLLLACQSKAKAPAADSVTAAAPALDTAQPPAPPPAPAPVAPALDTTTVVFPGLVLDTDSVPWDRYPRVLVNGCIGETCSTRFEAIACREVRLRTA